MTDHSIRRNFIRDSITLVDTDDNAAVEADTFPSQVIISCVPSPHTPTVGIDGAVEVSLTYDQVFDLHHFLTNALASYAERNEG